MKLTILGNYGPYPKHEENTSGYLLSTANTTVAFEMGAGVFSTMQNYIEPHKISAIIISHLHYDHISDLGVYNYYLESLSRKGVFNDKIKLYLPKDNCANYDYISQMKYFDVIPVYDGDCIKVDEFIFKFFVVKHPILTLGFRATDKNKTFMYSGDTDLCDNIKNNIKGVNLALLDCAFLNFQYGKNSPHMSVNICLELAKEFGVDTVLTHYLPTNNIIDYINEIHDTDNIHLSNKGEIIEF